MVTEGAASIPPSALRSVHSWNLKFKIFESVKSYHHSSRFSKAKFWMWPPHRGQAEAKLEPQAASRNADLIFHRNIKKLLSTQPPSTLAPTLSQVTLESLNKVRNGIGLATAGASMRMWSCRKLLTHHVLSLQVKKSRNGPNILYQHSNFPLKIWQILVLWIEAFQHSTSYSKGFSTFAFLMKLWKSPRAKVLGPVLCRRSRTNTSHLDLQVGTLVTRESVSSI